MNDFTKEELEQIVKWSTTDIDLNPSNLEISLFDKIQSMIDNYCEHLWTDGSGNMIFCSKCQAYGGKR